jgi:hypothetical protein
MNSMSDFLRHVTGATTFAAAAISVVIASGCASAPSTAPPVRLDFPAPDKGPGRPDLSRADQGHIDKGWDALQSGNPSSARASASQAGANPATELLSLQAALVANDNVMAGLERLTKDHSEYAAAWLTLSVAAESADDEAGALDAASRGAELWPDKRWIERERTLYQRYVGNRIESARDLYESDHAEAALEALVPALALDPDNRDAVLVKARALVALDQPDRAEAALSGLPRDPEVVRLAGNIARSQRRDEDLLLPARRSRIGPAGGRDCRGSGRLADSHEPLHVLARRAAGKGAGAASRQASLAPLGHARLCPGGRRFTGTRSLTARGRDGQSGAESGNLARRAGTIVIRRHDFAISE